MNRFFFFKQKTAYEIMPSLVGSEMCIRDRLTSLVLGGLHQRSGVALPTGGRADPAIGNEALAGTRYIRTWYIIRTPH